MKRVLAVTVCFAACAVLASAHGAGKGKGKAAPKIEGVWLATGGNSDGKKIPDDFISKAMLVVTFKEGKYKVEVMGKEVESGTYKTDAKKKPAHLDNTIVKGKDEGKVQLGIFKVEGDVLTVALPQADYKNRPKNFEGGKDIEVTVLKRQK